MEPIKEVTLETLITSITQIQYVKVDRMAFLTDVFSSESVELKKILDVGPIIAGCSQKMLRNISYKHIAKRTIEASALSFVAGLPGGIAMAATIPADTLQFFGMTLKLAQELSYIYGEKDLWQNEETDGELIKNRLLLYCGVMFGVANASVGVRLLSSQIAKQVLKKIPQKALTKTMWYPIVKQMCKSVGIKITKNTVAKGASKAIPIVGGFVSGAITFASMKQMGIKLVQTFEKANFNYSKEEFETDYDIIQAELNS